MSLRGIPAGSTIDRAYYSVPDAYTTGQEYAEWADAVRAAQAMRAGLVERLTESLAGYSTAAEVAATADAQIVIELRWVIRSDGIERDMPVERFGNVDQFRVS